MKGFVSFYFILWLRFYCEEVLSVTSNRQRSTQGLMKECPTPESLWPLATVMNPAVNLGWMCPIEDGSGVLSERPAPCGPVGALLLTLPRPSAHRHFDNGTGRVTGCLGLGRVNHDVLIPLIQFRGPCCTSVVPCPFEVPKEWKREVVGSRFGRIFPNRNCTFCWILCCLW